MLEQALRAAPDNARYVFYLAQSYRDAQQPGLAIDRYRQRATMGGFDEEVWYSLYQVAQLQQQTGAEWTEVRRAYFQAFACRPHRAEPLYRIGLHHQHNQEFALARFFFWEAMQIPFPATDLLFVEFDVFEFLLPLEYAVACYWLGLHEEAMRVTDRLLANESLSPERREHLLRNRQCSVDILQATGYETR